MNNQLFETQSKSILEWHLQFLKYDHHERQEQEVIRDHLLQMNAQMTSIAGTASHAGGSGNNGNNGSMVLTSETTSVTSGGGGSSSSTTSSPFQSHVDNSTPIRIQSPSRHNRTTSSNGNLAAGNADSIFVLSSSSSSFSTTLNNSSLSHMFGLGSLSSSSSSLHQNYHQRSNSFQFQSSVSSMSSFNSGSGRGKRTQQNMSSRKSVASNRSNRSTATQRNNDNAFAAMIEEKLAGVEGYFLNSAFFIFEQSAEQELDSDDDTISEKLRFFHPYTVPLNSQLNFVSVLQGLITFSEGFNDKHDTVALLALSHSKLAIHRVGSLIFALSMPNTVPDNMIQSKLSLLLDTMHFFHGPWEHVEDRCSSSSEYCETIKQVGLELIPLVNYLTQSPASNFDPLPYTELPTRGNSIFISASQILNIALESYGNIGGCVVYDDSILCTQLDEAICRFVVYRVFCLNQFLSAMADDSAIHLASDPQSSTSDDEEEEEFIEDDECLDSEIEWITDNLGDLNIANRPDAGEENLYGHFVFSSQDRLDYIPIFVSHDHAKRLREEYGQDREESEDEREKRNERRKRLPSFLVEKHVEGEYLGLVVHRLANISLVIVTEIDALLDMEHMVEIRTATKEKLRWLSKRSREQMLAMFNNNTSVPNNTNNYHVIKDNIRMMQTFNGGTPPPGNSLIFDRYTKMATGSFHSDKFLEDCSLAHNSYEANPAFTKIILKNETDGYLYSKKIFGTEVYFRNSPSTQPAPRTRAGAIASNDISAENLEPMVRERIRSQYKLNVL